MRENRRNLEWLGITWLGITWLTIMKLHDLGLEKAPLNYFSRKTVYFILLYLNGKVVLKRSFWRKSFNPTCHIKMNWKPKMNLELSHLVSRIILVYGSHFKVSNRFSLLDDWILQWCSDTCHVTTCDFNIVPIWSLCCSGICLSLHWTLIGKSPEQY